MLNFYSMDYKINAPLPNGVYVYLNGKKFISGENINNYIARNCTWIIDDEYNIDEKNDIYMINNKKRYKKELSYGCIPPLSIIIITLFIFFFLSTPISNILSNVANNNELPLFIVFFTNVISTIFPILIWVISIIVISFVLDKKNKTLLKFTKEAVSYYEENQDKYKDLNISLENYMSPTLNSLLKTMQQYHTICPNCGGFAKDGDKICQYCGESLKIINEK